MTAVAPLQLPPAIDRLFDAPLRERLVALRHALHADPELSWQEERTADRLTAAAAGLAPADVRRLAGTGVLVRMRGRRKDAPVVAVRGDIDALPIGEETGLPFASRNAGVMHACGHDVHATWALGAAALLAAHPADGDVVVLLQPAEETGNGARAMIEGGALDGVQAIFGAHVDRRFPIGQVVAQEGPLAASADTFEIDVVGRGAHAARPHEAADPIVAAGALIGALQTVVARRLDPATPGVVSLGQIAGGSAPNVIPERVRLAGTIRATEPATRTLLTTEVERIARSVAAAYGCEAQVRLEIGPPPVVNLPQATGWAREGVRRVLGEDALVPLGFLNLAGEDFAHYLERVPGCFLRIGAREQGGAAVAAHSPRFYAAEESIFVGAAVLAEAARVASAALCSRA